MNNNTPEWARRINQEHARKVELWLSQSPGRREMYEDAFKVMGVGAIFTLSDANSLTDPMWDGHDIRHRFGIKDDIIWLQTTIHLESKGLTGWCSPSGAPIDGDIETYPLYEQLDFHIRMDGLLWMMHAFGIPDTEEVWWCSECDRECLFCHAPLRIPKKSFCGNCHTRDYP